MLPTRDELLSKAKNAPATPVAVEAFWDGDTTGWIVGLTFVYVKRSLWRKQFRDHILGRFRESGGDYRLFEGSVPPWPEAQLASEIGQEIAEHFGVPFYFPSPDHPEDQCPRWWERDRGYPCKECGIQLLQTDPCPWRGTCYQCYLKIRKGSELS